MPGEPSKPGGRLVALSALRACDAALAVGTYYLWHRGLGLATAPSVVGAVVMWAGV